ncbi:MAG: type II toxin-antitoxin system VapB family antitoxin [Clostridiales bacterium]|nr:type II toxin-antitoxin system VapB family antitoxin [Clostridiales bacterium]
MRTNIVIDDELMRQATIISGLKTKKDVVEKALREFVIANSVRNLTDLRGKIEFSSDYDYKSLREGR